MTTMEIFEPRSFAVVGAGPVGCIVAAFLSKGGFRVVLCDVVQELTAPAVREGIAIDGAERIRAAVTEVVSSIDDIAAHDPDVIFIAVKANALPLIASAIEGFIRQGTYVVSWQNGIDTAEELAATLGKKPLMRAVVNYGCTLLGPCHVKMDFHRPPHYIQALDAASQHAAEVIAKTLHRCGLPTAPTDRIVSMVWRKTIMNASLNPVCAVTGLSMAQAIHDPIIFGIIDALIKECVKVARANEIQLGWDFYSYALEYIRHAGDHKPSMLIDIEKRRRTEIDSMNGKFVEYGEQAGIDTPYNKTFRALIKALEP